MSSSSSQNKILVYGAMWCGDCRRSKSFLERQKVDFDWIDVEQNPAAQEEMQKLNGGVQSIPTILLPNGQVLIEPSNKALGDALGLAVI